MTAPENVFIELRKIKTYSKGILTFKLKNRFFKHQYQKQVNMFVFISRLASHEVYIHIQYFFGGER